MKVTILGSGSGGNSILVEAGSTRVLVDAGFSGRQIEARLAQVGVEPVALSAVVVTHEHGDHTRGVGVFARRHGTPVYITDVTRDRCAALFKGEELLNSYRAGYPFSIGDVEVLPFLTVHDAADPVAVAVVDGKTGCRVGIATDLGRATTGIRHALEGCHVLILEANHDEKLLRTAAYPWSVKDRIASSHGHLSNRAAAQLAVELHHPQMAAVILAHLSQEANAPELALEVVGKALRKHGFQGQLMAAHQDIPLGPLDVVGLRGSMGTPQLELL